MAVEGIIIEVLLANMVIILKVIMAITVIMIEVIRVIIIEVITAIIRCTADQYTLIRLIRPSLTLSSSRTTG